MGITLKAARINKGLTQKQAAKCIGVRVETLAKYEKGKTFPNVPILQKIEHVYEIEYKDLIFLPNLYSLRVNSQKEEQADFTA